MTGGDGLNSNRLEASQTTSGDSIHALSSWAARRCLVNRHPGRPSHHAVPASHAACVAPPSAPPTPPPFKSVRPLSQMRRAR